VAFAAACCSYEIKTREKEFYILLLVMTGGIWARSCRRPVLFHFFHELALVPTFIMIGVWGRGRTEELRHVQITLYLSIGALLALGRFDRALFAGAGRYPHVHIPTLRNISWTTRWQRARRIFIFRCCCSRFGILVSLWPFHSWAPLGTVPRRARRRCCTRVC